MPISKAIWFVEILARPSWLNQALLVEEVERRLENSIAGHHGSAIGRRTQSSRGVSQGGRPQASAARVIVKDVVGNMKPKGTGGREHSLDGGRPLDAAFDRRSLPQMAFRLRVPFYLRRRLPATTVSAGVFAFRRSRLASSLPCDRSVFVAVCASATSSRSSSPSIPEAI